MLHCSSALLSWYITCTARRGDKPHVLQQTQCVSNHACCVPLPSCARTSHHLSSRQCVSISLTVDCKDQCQQNRTFFTPNPQPCLRVWAALQWHCAFEVECSTEVPLNSHMHHAVCLAHPIMFFFFAFLQQHTIARVKCSEVCRTEYVCNKRR